MRYNVGDLATAKNCPNPKCKSHDKPIAGTVAEPLNNKWFFNCPDCDSMVEVEQALF